MKPNGNKLVKPSSHTTEETRRKFPGIEWGQIVGMGNAFIHGYFGIDLYVTRDIIETDIPDLKPELLKIR